MRCTLALTLTCLWSVVALAVPTSIKIPDISAPVLDGATQPSNGTWANVIPNALADYFTYVPYTTADAVKLGFPSTCGNLAKGDTASTEDCYTITVKSFMQPLALQGIFGGGPGLVGLDGVTPLQTKAWGYGSGGANWTLPYYDTTKAGVTVNTPVTGNAPAPFADGTLSSSGIWHFPAPTIKGTRDRPIRVQWLNELPNEAPTGLDPSVDCGPNAPNCYPYNRITTHVHGAHVSPESDGLASAWFTPDFAIVGEDFVSTRQHGPEGTYRYPMDQEASTIWYHDHAMGTTHNNTNMGMAGFFPITDSNEQSLIAANILPTGAYELGFALQDRHFDAATGNMVMPDYPIYDLNAAGCTFDVNGLPDPATCPLVPWMLSPDGTHLIPYNDPTGVTPVLGGTSATLEYFGNIPVVNGVVYGKYSVEPRVYRMRFIGGTDSRTWVMQLVRNDTSAVIPFWQIGTEQGLLNYPVERQEMDLMPGERLDVLVDFTGIPAGTRVMMKNLGNDDPWPGYFDYAAQKTAGTWLPSPTITEIMAFDVVQMPTVLGSNPPVPVTDNIIKPAATTSLRPLIAPVPAAGAAPPGGIQNTRVVSLMEITDGYGRTMPTIDSRGFKPPGVPVTEIVKLYDTEQWDIVNTTVDAHPMHLHQVAFKVIDRQALVVDPLGTVTSFTPPTDDIINQVFTPASYTVDPASTPIPPDAWDDGWKDTVATPPGYVTRVWARFDLTGEYVWHCHILSHEEHDMMRNFIVTDANFSAPEPAKLTVPPTSVTGTYTINWVGTAIPGVSYELQEATDNAFATAVTVYNGTAPTFTVIKTLNNTFYYRLRAIPPAASGFTTSLWKEADHAVTVQIPVSIAPVTLLGSFINIPYTAAFTAVNGVPPYTWTVTGLPSGLIVDPVSGIVSGTPLPDSLLPTVKSQRYPLTITATDSSLPAVSAILPANLQLKQSVPTAPTALTVMAVTPTQADLTLIDNSNNESGFTLERSTSVKFNKGLIEIQLATNQVNYSDTTVQSKTTYYYRVSANNAAGTSVFSNVVNLTTP